MEKPVKPVVIGVSASLRNAYFGRQSDDLCNAIVNLESREALFSYIDEQTKVRADEFLDSGREDGLPFDQIYKNLRKQKTARGLSNSESGLVAALWAAKEAGSDIRHLGLARHFPASGEWKEMDDLKNSLLEADGIILSGPVYFGDRGSLAQEFIEFIRSDKELREHLKDKVYGGVAVGAKRNGGQETTLIYQMVDMLNLSMYAVGNDGKTTSQYGGTLMAGDVGTAGADDYGLNTSIGLGSRVAKVAKVTARRERTPLPRKIKIAIWLVQDTKQGKGMGYLNDLVDSLNKSTNVEQEFELVVRNFTSDYIHRCIACDICPIDPIKDDGYNCIINQKHDLFYRDHVELLDVDALLLAAYSPEEDAELVSVYQRFIERTRYWRRDDYALGDKLVAPLVISEINSRRNMHIRMMTSLIRHHTVLQHPVLAMEHNGELINRDAFIANAEHFVNNAINLYRGLKEVNVSEGIEYNPMGYVISKQHKESKKAGAKG